MVHARMQRKKKQFYFYKMSRKFREENTEENRINMVKARSAYKTMLRKCKFEYDKKQNDQSKTYMNKILLDRTYSAVSL